MRERRVDGLTLDTVRCFRQAMGRYLASLWVGLGAFLTNRWFGDCDYASYASCRGGLALPNSLARGLCSLSTPAGGWALLFTGRLGSPSWDQI